MIIVSLLAHFVISEDAWAGWLIGSCLSLSHLFKWLEYCIGFALLGDVCLLDLPHALDVLSEVAAESSIDGGVVDGDEVGDEIGRSECDDHGSFGAPE